MANSRVRIDTHINEDKPQTSFVGRGETAWETDYQCPDCAKRHVASNGVTRWCMLCGWQGSVRHPKRREERVQDEW